MSKQHLLTVSDVKYPGGLRIVECHECRYAFAVEVDQYGIMELDTRVTINEGDYTASHSLFQAYDELPTVEATVEAVPDTCPA